MSSLTLPTGAAAPTSSHGQAQALGALLIAEGVLSFAPLIVLGPAIGWPASLANPAAQQLGAIGAEPEAVAFGYSLYLVYSVLVAPVMIGLAARALGGLHRPLAATVAVFAALSALARSIGILRWLTVMPALATAHASADPVARAQIELLFGALTAYGGGIGELLGVSLFMALSVGLLSAEAWRRRSLPRWIAGLGIGAALLLAGLLLPTLGIAVVKVPVALAVSCLSLWMMAAGGWCLHRAR